MKFDAIHTHSPNIIDHMANSTSQAIQRTQRLADQALDGLDESVQALRDHAAPKLNQVTQRASEMAQQGVQSARATGRRLRESATQVSEGTSQYVRDEPIKSLLIAAAAGALLMALANILLERNRR